MLRPFAETAIFLIEYIFFCSFISISVTV